jgi:hypothetical protein
MQTTLPDDTYAAYIKGRRDEQYATEELLNILRLQGLLDVATCNMILSDLNRIDRRIKKEAN